MKIGHLVDVDGWYLEDALDTTQITDSTIVVYAICPDGFYKPRWSFETESWSEGLSEAEIQTIKNVPKSETEAEKIIRLEYSLADSNSRLGIAEGAILALMDLNLL